MFLENMTWKQVLSRILANEDFLQRNHDRLVSEWCKTIKRVRPLPLCFCKSIKSHDKDEFLVIANSLDGKELGTATLAAMPTEKGKSYIICDRIDDSDFLRDKLTPHFIKRYRERGLKVEDWPTEKVVAHFFMRNQRRVIVFNDPDDERTAVYATEEGILICKKDEKKGFLELSTYIDDGMLYGTQRMAKEKIFSKIPKDIDPDQHYYISTIIGELLPIAQDIYSKYKSGATDYLVFKKENIDEEVKLNFNLKKGKEAKSKELSKEKTKSPNDTIILAPNFMTKNPVMLETAFRDDLMNHEMEVKGDPNGKGKMFFKEKGKVVIEYKGELKDGKPHGHGILTTKDGHTYDGNWVEGELEGHCRHTYDNGSCYEEGIFKGMNRNGMCYTHTPHFELWAMYLNDEQTGNFKIKTSEFTWEGDSRKMPLNGKGKLTFRDGRIQEGTFKDGMLNGKGKETYEDGAIVEAPFRKGLADGLGTLTETDGTVYTGMFEDGDLNGYVQETLPDGTSQVVEFCYGENTEDWDDEDWDDERNIDLEEAKLK